MAPKKLNGSSDQRSNGNESFMAAFDKPTQIYRFLKTRTTYYPCFMHRTLYYMKGKRSTRTNAGRKTFDINSLLARKLKEKEKREKGDKAVQMGKSLVVGFMSYDDIDSNGRFDRELKYVKVQTSLEKTFHKRRKEGSTSSNSKDIGINANVAIRYSTDSMTPEKIPLLVISPDMLEADITSSHKLVFRVDLPSFSISSTNFDEHPLKHGRHESLFADSIVYEKLRSQILEGEYEIVLKDEIEYQPTKKLCTWESIPDDQIPEWCNNNLPIEDAMNEFDKFDGGCKTLRIYFKWTKDPPTGGYVDRSELTVSNDLDDYKENDEQNNNGKEICQSLLQHVPLQKEKTFVFQFNHGSSLKQQLSERENYACPWCNLNCHVMFVLMKHLKLCHPRFNFIYVPDEDNPRVDVSLNDQYDSSYSGSPHDLLRTAKDRKPERKTVSTFILVFRPRREMSMNMLDYSEINDNDNDPEVQRTYATGHNRIYFHTETCMPIHAQQLDYDSEGEKDPKWLQRKTKQMIDEFSDVNEGEKELMKMWNLHVMHYGFVGDCQVPLACDMFVKLRGEELLRKNLYRNYIIHLTSMFDYGLISPETLHKNILKLQKILSEHEDIQTMMNEARQKQQEHWKSRDNKASIKVEEPTTPNKNNRKLLTNQGASTSQNRLSIKSPKVMLENLPKYKKVEKNSTAIKSASNSNKRKSSKLDESTKDDRKKPKLEQVIAKPQIVEKRIMRRRESILIYAKCKRLRNAPSK